MKAVVPVAILIMSLAAQGASTSKSKKADALDAYLERVRSAPMSTLVARSPGSLWSDSGLLSEAVADARARNVGDLVTIQIVELTTASTAATVDSQRQFSASSGINALAGKINTSGIESLFSPSSARALKGKGTTTADSKLQTTLSGRVVAVLPSGALVIEAQRDVRIHDQRNRVIVRGIARPVDISAGDSIVSTKLSDLEVELSGKGVVSDGTRQPNVIMRLLLRLVNF